MTMRYAHLAPDHLEDVLLKNPLTYKLTPLDEAVKQAKRAAENIGEADLIDEAVEWTRPRQPPS